MIPIVFILVSLAVTVPATGQFFQLLGSAVQTAGQAAGQAAGQVTNQFARYAEDFYMFTDKSKQAQRTFTPAEVSRCTGQGGSCLYVVYDGLVLDLTEFAAHHCGGSRVLLQYGGQDASRAMRAAGMPRRVFDTLLRRFVIGKLVQNN